MLLLVQWGRQSVQKSKAAACQPTRALQWREGWGAVMEKQGRSKGDLGKVVRLGGPEIETSEPNAKDRELAWWGACRVGGVFPAEGQRVWRSLAGMSWAPSRS